jgi:peptidoglycan biosynthesis protein MviN/MurJ (putative lipid II flippase)
LRDNWTADQQRLCIEVITIFGVYLAAIAASSVIDGCLYAFGSFFVTTVTIGVRSLLPLPFLFLAPAGATALLLSAGALAAGECLRALFLGRALRRAIAGLADEPSGADAGAVTVAPPSVWSTALPYGLAMVLFGSFQLVDRVVASSLAPGSVTVLDLAEKAFYAPVTILMSSVMLVSGARWAGLATERPTELQRDFAQTVLRAALLSSGLAAAAITVLLIARVAVDTTLAGVDTGQFCVVLAILMVGFPAAVVTNAGVRLLTVLRRTRTFPALAAVSLVADVACAVVGAHVLGIAGIALAGTLWRTVNLVLFLVISASALRRLAPAATFTGREHPAPPPSITLEPSS